MNLFPIPKTQPCPYCGEICGTGTLAQDGKIHHSHKIEEKVRVGDANVVTLITLHQFVTMWDGDEWVHADVRFGSSKVLQRIKLGNGHSTDWSSCD